ncbi:TPA: hypothetical protein ACGA4X_003575 [Acinetobacter baumannii]
MEKIRCKACHQLFIPCSRVKTQSYCSKPECQRHRKRLWQKEKINSDPAYRDNQYAAHKSWLRRHPEYESTYRQEHHPNKSNINFTKKIKTCPYFPTCQCMHKMDSILTENFPFSGDYLIQSIDPNTKKMVSFIAHISLISICYKDKCLKRED